MQEITNAHKIALFYFQKQKIHSFCLYKMIKLAQSPTHSPKTHQSKTLIQKNPLTMPPKPSEAPQAARPRLSPLLRMMIGALLSLIVLVGLIVLIAWLVVQPRKLKYTIEQGSISGYNLTRNDILNANFQFVLRLNNPNRRISVYYDKIDATMSYEDQVLSTNDVHSFYQPTRNVTHLDLYLTPKEAAVYGDVAQDMRMEHAAGKIEVDVSIRARIRIKIGIFKIHKKLNVLCESVTLPFNPSKGFERVYCDVEIDD